MCIGLNVKYPLFLSDFDETWNFWGRFFKNTQLPNFMKIRPVGAELLHANCRFSQSCERVYWMSANVPVHLLRSAGRGVSLITVITCRSHTRPLPRSPHWRQITAHIHRAFYSINNILLRTVAQELFVHLLYTNNTLIWQNLSVDGKICFPSYCNHNL
jgi:hypothetical protein